MFRKLLPRSIYDVMAAIACFGVLAGGTAYAANTVFSSDIVDGEVKSIDVGQNEIKSADVKDESLTTFDVSTFLGADVVDNTLTGADIGDGSLNDQDVGQATFVDFAATIGTVAAHNCRGEFLTGIDARADHLLLTPDWDTSHTALVYEILSRRFEESAVLRVCNPTNSDINDGTTNFNLLVFDAQ